jgi:hypothetical protein
MNSIFGLAGLADAETSSKNRSTPFHNQRAWIFTLIL